MVINCNRLKKEDGEFVTNGDKLKLLFADGEKTGRVRDIDQYIHQEWSELSVKDHKKLKG